MKRNDEVAKLSIPAPLVRTSAVHEVFADYDIHRWPLYVPPLPEEPLRGWARRFSYRYGLTPREVNQALGLPQNSSRNTLKIFLSHADRARDYLGFDPRSINQHFDKDLPCTAELSRHFYLDMGRFCPRCLAENGIWRLDWESRWALVCPRHLILYQNECPVCGQSPWHSISWLGQVAPIYQCTERRPPATRSEERRVRKWCSGDLRAAPCIQAPPDLLAAENALRKRIPGEIHRTAETESFGPLTLNADDADTLFALLVEEAIDASSAEAHVSRQVKGVVLAYHAFLELQTWAARSPALEELLVADNVDRLLHHGTCSDAALHQPVILAWYINRNRGRLSFRMQLACRTARTIPSLPAQSHAVRDPLPTMLNVHKREPARPPAEWIPQLIPLNTLTLPWSSDPVGRALGSMCFLNLGRDTPWSYVAMELGLPRRLERSAAARLRRVSQDEWATLLCSMEEYFEKLLDEPPRINYRARRLVANEPGLLFNTIRREYESESSITSNIGAFSLLFWEWYTGGHASFAPEELKQLAHEGHAPLTLPILRTDTHDLMPVFVKVAGKLAERARFLLEWSPWQKPP